MHRKAIALKTESTEATKRGKGNFKKEFLRL